MATEQKSRGLILAALVGVLVILCGVVVATAMAFRGDDESPRPTPSASSSAKSDSACGLQAGDTEVPTSSPEATWDFIGKVAAPRSREAGPAGNTSSGLRTCFAHSPAGALFAAVTWSAEVAGGGERGLAALREKSLPADLARSASKDDLDETGPVSQLVGFRFDDYTDSRVTVTLAFQVTEGPNRGAIGATPLTLAWAAGDWKVMIDRAPEALVLDDLDGFVKWGAVA